MTTLPRRPLRTLSLTAAAAAAATVVLAAPASAAEIVPPPLDPHALQVLQVLDETNAARAAAGCGPLLLTPALTAAADRHTDEMAATGLMSHTGADGSSPRTRLAAQGVLPRRTAENIALGYAAADVVDAWLASPGHRANILDCSLGFVGISERPGAAGQFWTQVLASA
ncbi:uncharacterized protein YkwD [Kineococcus radiotolerans]|uniref:SCP-like extracellular n=2 Tax=Kineococcus radiotolerans TaxID=131568 RepID=A6W4Z4_KINRD|nr:CAP domain-containing protein [Kineococcus radiotolerans]ABS01883.1 SCP-like extracellular [Kineococcus radiotolerans SRS30216 = ATCC BAA-149]MBB2900973.1 uncharacterized protein YkwD [Kineococcus radiotolerans]